MSLVRQSFSGRWGMEAPTLFGMSSILTVAPIWRDYTGSAHLAEGIPLYTLTISVCSWKALFYSFLYVVLTGRAGVENVCVGVVLFPGVWLCDLWHVCQCDLRVRDQWWLKAKAWSLLVRDRRVINCLLLEPTVALSQNQLTIGDLW